jgi:hypothetical protein
MNSINLFVFLKAMECWEKKEKNLNVDFNLNQNSSKCKYIQFFLIQIIKQIIKH